MNTRSRPAGTRPSSAEVRDRLLDAAESLLAERQPAAITSRDIARAANLSDGVLYNHFGDKHELLLAALVRRFDRLSSGVAGAPVGPGAGSIEQSAREVVRRAHAVQVTVLPMLANLVGDPALLQRFLVEIHRPPLGGDVFGRPIVDYLAAEQALGRLGSFDPVAATDLILGAVLLQGLLDVLGHRPPGESARHLDGITRTILSGLGPADRPPRPTRRTRSES